jgi:hypothetical protein
MEMSHGLATSTMIAFEPSRRVKPLARKTTACTAGPRIRGIVAAMAKIGTQYGPG